MKKSRNCNTSVVAVIRRKLAAITASVFVRKLFFPILGIAFLIGISCFLGCTQQAHRADLVILIGGEPESLDPDIVTGQVDQNIVSELFEGLTRFNKAGVAEPGLASSWDIASDHQTYIFHLRKKGCWSNGQLIKAEDVVASWKRALMPATGGANSYQLFVIQGAEDFAHGKTKDFSQVGIKALDQETLQVTLSHPTPYFLDLCATPIFAVVPTKLIEQLGDHWTKPQHIITNGPYQLLDWRINDKISLHRNPLYWDHQHVAIESIDLLPIAQANIAYNFYASGAADIIFGKLFPPALIKELRTRKDFHTACFLGTEFLRFNCAVKPFSDERVRKAFALCVNQNLLVNKMARSGELPAYGFVPPGILGYHNRDATYNDPSEARRLLAEAGYPEGKGFPLITYLYNEGQLTEGVAIELQAAWKKELGISVLLARQEWKVYLGSLNQLDYNIGRSSWVGDYPDPNTFLDIFAATSGNNRTGWQSPEYDGLLQQASMTVSPVERCLLFQKAERLLLQDQAVIVPLFYYAGVQIYNPARWGGIQENILDKHPLWQIYQK